MAKIKVLVLAYFFPPYPSTGGQRPYSWYKHFSQFDIEPTFITRHWNENSYKTIDFIQSSINQTIVEQKNDLATIINLPFNPDILDRYLIATTSKKRNSLLRFIFKNISRLRFFFSSLDKTANFYAVAKQQLQKEKYDYIIATGSPFILFKYASKLSNEFNTPWIADFRDGWSDNTSFNQAVFFKRIVFKKIVEQIEKKHLKNVCFITSSADPYTEGLKKIHPTKNVYTIYNGYNSEFINQAFNVQTNKEFTITYAGRIYPYQQLELFLEGFKLFTEQVNNLSCKLVFVGLNYDEKQKKRVLLFNEKLNSFIVATNKIAKEEAIACLKQSHVLLLLSDNKTKALASKLFDYLLVQKPILLVPEDNNIMSSIIDKCNAGHKVSSAKDVYEVLCKLYDLHIKHEKTPLPIYTEQYSWEVQVKNMATLLKQYLK